MEITEVCSVEQLNTQEKKVVIVNDQEILLIYADGEYFAVSNVCPHAQTRLLSGRVEDGTLTCSNHGTCFDLKTGEIRTDKIDEDLLEYLDVDNLPFDSLKIYPLKIENGMVLIEV